MGMATQLLTRFRATFDRLFIYVVFFLLAFISAVGLWNGQRSHGEDLVRQPRARAALIVPYLRSLFDNPGMQRSKENLASSEIALLYVVGATDCRDMTDQIEAAYDFVVPGTMRGPTVTVVAVGVPESEKPQFRLKFLRPVPIIFEEPSSLKKKLQLSARPSRFVINLKPELLLEEARPTGTDADTRLLMERLDSWLRATRVVSPAPGS